MNINIRSIVLISVALVIAVVTALLARSLVSAPDAGPVAVVQQVNTNLQILVSNKSISTGSFIKREDLDWQSWPDDNVSDFYIQKDADANGESLEDSIIGSVAKSTISPGEPIIDGRLVKPGSRGFMAAVLTPGKRAVSININSRTGLSGFVFPGDAVDIILTHTVAVGGDSEAPDLQVAETVLEDIRVLAIDTQMSNQTNTPAIGKVATFEVTPKQAEIIALSGKMGELSLVLRSLAIENFENDASVSKTSMATNNNVTFTDEVSKVIAGQTSSDQKGKKKQNVVVLRGAAIESLTFTTSQAISQIPKAIIN